MTSLADLLTQHQPQFQTRQALVVLGLQNDFLSHDGKLPVSTDTGFVERIKELVPKFRELAGDIIWVRSEFDAESRFNGSESGEVIVDDASESRRKSSLEQPGNDIGSKEASVPSNKAATPRAKVSRSKRKKALNMFKDIGKKKQPAVPQAPSAPHEDLIHEEEELYLSSSKRGPCCKPGTEGAEFASSINDTIDVSNDIIVVKSHYSAFNETPLLISLRTKLITELYICGCMTNVSVYATALDAARHGFTINILEDCLGYRTVGRHERALSSMTEDLAAISVTSEEILEDLNAPPEGEENGEDEEIGKMIGGLKLEDPSQMTSKTQPLPASIAELTDSLGAISIALGKAKATNTEQGLLSLLAADDDKPEPSPRKALRSYRSQPEIGKGYVRSRIRIRPKEARLADLDQDAITPLQNHEKDNVSEAKRSSVSSRKKNRPEISSGSAPRAPPLPESSTIPSHNAEALNTSTPSTLPRIKNSKSTPSLKLASQSTSSDSPPPIPKTYQPSRPSHSKAQKPMPSTSSTPTMSAPTKKKLQSLANLTALGPDDTIGEGDTYIRYGLIPPTSTDDITDVPLANTIFSALYHEVKWQKMYHAAGEVPRLVAVQGTIEADGSMPIYRHPSDQAPPLLPFTKHVDTVRKESEKIIGHPLNHVLIQLYRDGKDYISEHSDKSLDIARGSSIVNASFGARRTMRIRTKKSGASSSDVENQRTTQRIPMPHNSILVLGLKTNQFWLHGISADKRLASERSEDEKAYNGMRISLTFRNIGTFLNKDKRKIWGQGAKSKEKEAAGKVVNGDKKETEKMIRAFGVENHESDGFDWEEVYGEGFDVLHFRHAEDKE